MAASRRAIGSVLQLSAKTYLPSPTQALAIRAPLIQAASQSCLPAQFARSTPRPIGVRPYSQASQNKIWSFEDIQKATSGAKPSVVVIDTREPGELQQTGRIPGAINIPVTSAPDSYHIKDEEFEDRFGFPRPDKDTEVVFYCKAGVRSRAAAGLARDAGWTKVGEYPGSWIDWFEKGGHVQR